MTNIRVKLGSAFGHKRTLQITFDRGSPRIYSILPFGRGQCPEPYDSRDRRPES